MFFGSIVASVTPFLQGEVDLPAFKKMIQYQLNGKTHGIVVAGSTGEGSMLTMNERENLIKIALQNASAFVPIIAGCSAGSTHESLALLRQAEDLGCSAALVIPPYYVRPNPEGIVEHFKKLAEHTSIPIILYNNPSRVGVDLSVDLILELARIPSIVAVKDSHPDLSRLAYLRLGIDSLKQKKKIPHTKPFSILVGDSSSFAPALALGADGCISVTANALPQQSYELYYAWKDQDQEKFAMLRDQLLLLDKALSHDTNPIPIKYALSKIGLCTHEMRLPLTPLPLAQRHSIDTVLNTLSFSEKEREEKVA